MTIQKRWYDHDTCLLEIMDMLQNYKAELREHAEKFLDKIETQVPAEIIDSFYNEISKVKRGNRWYDDDPVLRKTIELLRIVPTEIQNKAAKEFLLAMKEQGITPDVLKGNL